MSAESAARVRDIRIVVTSLTRDAITFELIGADLSFANALRRVMIAEVPTVAIDTVEIYENSSPLFDEFITHRLGLVPLTSLPALQRNMVFSRDCSCSHGCAQCTVKFKLDVTNDLPYPANVTTKALQHLDDDSRSHWADIHPIGPAFQAERAGEADITLIKLATRQRLKLTATAKLGIGKEHGKWIPAGVATFAAKPEVLVDTDAMQRLRDAGLVSPAQLQAIAESCPVGVFGYLPDLEELTVAAADKCMFCRECYRTAEREGVPSSFFSALPSENHFLFTVESTGSLPPEEIVKVGLATLNKKIRMHRECFAAELGNEAEATGSNIPMG